VTADDLELEQLRALDPRIVDPATLWRVGSTRVHSWNECDRPDADIGGLLYMGDGAIELSVRDVIATVPRPVRNFAIENVAFFGVGHRSAGWQFDLPDFAGRTNLILLAHANSGLVCHELAHAWQLGHIPGRKPRNEAAENEAAAILAQFPAELRRELVTMQSETDVWADRAALAWGFPINACRGLVEDQLREIEERANRKP
jgi:hypothetical protein